MTGTRRRTSHCFTTGGRKVFIQGGGRLDNSSLDRLLAKALRLASRAGARGGYWTGSARELELLQLTHNTPTPSKDELERDEARKQIQSYNDLLGDQDVRAFLKGSESEGDDV